VSILNPSGRAPIIGDVDVFDCRVTDDGWPWAEKNAGPIAKHWQKAHAAKPEMFDGEVLIATEVGIEKSRLVSKHSIVRYAALNYWTASGFPRADAFNLFGAGLVVTTDGAVLLGKMAAHTANAGYFYFPCGTPDPDDVIDGKLDVEGSILRELEEETGLGRAHLKPSEQRWIAWDGALFCCARRYDAGMNAEAAQKIVDAHLAGQKKSELEAAVFVRSMDEVQKLNVPAYASALLGEVLPA
jgi:hypothetical protein